MSASYSYNITLVESGKIDGDSLTDEIRNSPISIAFDHLTIAATSITVVFKALLSSDELTTMSTIIASHKGISKAQPPVLVDFPTNIKDNVGNLMVKPRPVDGTLHLGFVYYDFTDRAVDFGLDSAYWTLNIASDTQTILRYHPPFAFYIDGGSFKTISGPTIDDIKTKVIIAPDIPAQMGGSKTIISNKHIIANDSLIITVPPKYVPYIPNVPANVVQIVFDHAAQETGKVELCLRLYC